VSPVAFWAAVRTEWTKLWTEPGLVCAAVAAPSALAIVGWFSASTAAAPVCPPELTGCELPTVDVVRLSLAGVHVGQIAAALLGVLMVTDEYASGTNDTTLIAIPRRLTALAAKAAAATFTVLAMAIPAVLGAVAVARSVLPDRGFTPAAGYPAVSLADGPTLRAAAGTVLYLGLVALLGLGIAVVVRDAIGALTIMLSLMYLLPVLGMLTDEEWLTRLIARYTPVSAGLSIQATEQLEQLPIGGWPGLAVAAAWAAAAVLAGAILFRFRDA
jgi:ABC-2 type transport system permease protein